jgi:hypothetical protein
VHCKLVNAVELAEIQPPQIRPKFWPSFRQRGSLPTNFRRI